MPKTNHEINANQNRRVYSFYPKKLINKGNLYDKNIHGAELILKYFRYNTCLIQWKERIFASL